MRTDATVRFVCGSTAVAVCVLLCGSTPMIIIAAKVLPFCRWIVESRLTIRLRESPTKGPRITPLLSQAANGCQARRHTQSEPAMRRQEVLESARPASSRQLRAADPTTTSLSPIQVGAYWSDGQSAAGLPAGTVRRGFAIALGIT